MLQHQLSGHLKKAQRNPEMELLDNALVLPIVFHLLLGNRRNLL